MTFPVTEHTVKTDRHTTGYLACGAEDGAVADLLPRLARALAVVAAPVAGLGGARLPLRRARHARLRPLEHLHAPRGLRAGADRRGHARAAGLARPRQGGVDRPRLGQPGGVEHGRRTIPTRRSAWRASACPTSPRASRSRAGAAGRPLGLSRGRAYPVGQWDYQFFYEESFDKARKRLRGQHPQRREGAVPQGQSRRASASPPHRVGAQGTAAGSAAAPGPTCRAMATCITEQDHGGLYRGADAQRLLRARLLVHEPQGQRRLCQARAERRQARDAGAVPARRLRHDLRDHDTRGSPSRCAATAPISPRSW